MGGRFVSAAGVGSLGAQQALKTFLKGRGEEMATFATSV